MLLSPPVRVCFVCSGNICHSPTAEVTLRRQAADAGLSDLVSADSAGVGDWHVGQEMDRRSRATLDSAGYSPGAHRAKQFSAADFAERDIVVALDSGHASALRELADDAEDPVAARASIVLLRAFDPELVAGEDPDVGDPYYGGASGFTDVLEQVSRSTAALLVAIEQAVRTGSDLVV